MARPKSIAYWMKASHDDWKTAKVLLASRRYVHSLFFGHQALEKALKGLYTAVHGKNPPYTHDLLRLARESGLDLSEEQQVFLRQIGGFNLEARYPEEKFQLHRKATRGFAVKYLTEIEKWLKRLESEVR